MSVRSTQPNYDGTAMPPESMIKFIAILAFVPAIIIHEVSHGLAALWLGDTTARDSGRLSLNPLRHIDLFGTVILPILLAMTTGVAFGYAKPVPIDLSRTRQPMNAMILTAIAGPLSNLLQALAAALIFRLLPGHEGLMYVKIFLMMYCLVNIILMTFNLVPIPPLDGSKVVAGCLPVEAAMSFLQFGRFGFVVIFIMLKLGFLSAVFDRAEHFTVSVLLGIG